MNTQEKLDKIADLKSAQSLRESEKQALIDQVLTPEIKTKIAEIEAEFAASDNVTDTINLLTEEVKSEVAQLGETVKGKFLMAVYSKPRVSWDTKALDDYIVSHPELTQFRKEGAPSVSIRGL